MYKFVAINMVQERSGVGLCEVGSGRENDKSLLVENDYR